MPVCHNLKAKGKSSRHAIFAMMWKDRYLWIAGLLMLLISLLMMGKVWKSPDSYFFSKGGDGLQTYYQSIYHVKNDTTWFHQDGLNYPYGESIFFTGGQPLVSNAVKLIQPVIDLSDNMVGITNLMMLLGVIICPMFLYLIFRELKLDIIWSVLWAIAFTMLSQQWERFSGHFPLSFLFAVPGMIYFLMMFYKSGKWKWTVVLFFYMTFLIWAHIYYLAFFGMISVAFWLALCLFNKNRTIGIGKSMIHLTVQIILPYVLLMLLISTSTEVTDRTSIPWGFMVFKSTWASYFFPYGMWYESMLSVLRPKNSPEWEGLAFIGGGVMVMIVSSIFYSIFRFRKMFFSQTVQENKTVIAFALAVLFCVAASFAFPFNIGREEWLLHTGPLQQFRGIGRFAFVAFYPLAILALILFTRISFRSSIVRNVFMSLLLLFTFSEGFIRVKNLSASIANERGDWLTGNPPVAKEMMDMTRYQAILPFPIIHVGSENIWLPETGEMSKHVMNLSLRLKLPTFATIMSRTSLAQTYKSIALGHELMERPEILKDLPDQRPLLLVCDTSHMSPAQLKLLHWGKHLYDEDIYSFYELPLSAFDTQRISNIVGASENGFQFDENVFISDSTEVVIADQGDTTFVMDEFWKVYKREVIPASWAGRKVKVSLWIKNFTQDLTPRTVMEIVQRDGEKVLKYDAEILGKRFIGMLKGDALVEYEVEINPEARELTIAFQNKLVPGREIQPFLLLIRPEDVICTILHHGNYIRNNRRYS